MAQGSPSLPKIYIESLPIFPILNRKTVKFICVGRLGLPL